MKRAVCCLILIVACAQGAVAAPVGEKAGQVERRPSVYLNECRDWAFIPGQLFGICPLARELVRQSVLIAARDEMGLATRDANLGDPLPSEKDGLPLEVVAPLREPLQVDLVRGTGVARVVLAHHELPTSVRRAVTGYQNLTELEESYSRQQFVEGLKKAGFSGQPNRHDETVAVPKRIERLLDEMNFLSQFHAVRELHRILRNKGESAAVLGALSRGYANMGVLTEFHPAYAHKVFKARALLYAQRMLAADPKSPVARWHRAYAAAMAGIHNWALTDLDEAEKSRQALPEKERPTMPKWAGLIGPLCRYDVEELTKRVKEGETGQLGVFVRFLAVDLAGGKAWPVQTAIETLESIPECYRVHNTLCTLAGVATLHRATLVPIQVAGLTIYKRLAAMPDLPLEAQAIVLGRNLFATVPSRADFQQRSYGIEGEFYFRHQLMDALCGSGWALGKDGVNNVAIADIGEPSWAAMGALIRDLSFMQVFHRARFERHSWGVSPDEWLAKSRFLVDGHRYRPFVEAFAWSQAKSSEAWTRAAKIEVSGVGLAAFAFYSQMTGSPNRQQPLGMWRDQDPVAQDVAGVLGVENNSPRVFANNLCQISRMMLKISPYSPSARTALVRYDWDNIQPQVAQWEKEATQYPGLLSAFAERYMAAGRHSEAERNLKLAVKIIPGELVLWRQLANVYRQLGLTDKWLATLEEYLQKPDYGLAHFQVQEEIANYFMERKEWSKALPYADGAAQCYSAWGLLCGARCHEGMQHWDQAELYYRAVAERYENCSFVWYFFCRRTGHGDVASAAKVAKRFAEMGKEGAAQPGVGELITYHLLDKQPAKALTVTESVVTGSRPNFIDLLWKSVTADLAGDTKKRDAALQQIKELDAKENPKTDVKNNPKDAADAKANETTNPPVAKNKIDNATAADREAAVLADLMLQDLAKGGKGQIDDDAVDKLIAPVKPQLASWLCYVLGQYLDSRGNHAAADRYCKRCLSIQTVDVAHSLAGAILAEHGEKPPTDDGKGI